MAETGIDYELEAALDEVGRLHVFDRARQLGWIHGPPPKYVWWGIIHEMKSIVPGQPIESIDLLRSAPQ